MSKTIGLKGTLNNQPKPLVTALASKVDIINREKDIGITEKAVKKIHHSEGKQFRLSIDTPEDIYEGMKIKTFKERTTVRDYVLGLIRTDLSR